MNIKPIHNEQDYETALKMVSPMFDKEPKRGTPEGDTFEVMLTLIRVYEDENHPVAPPSPIEAIKFRMEQGGLTAKTIASVIMTETNRVYEILKGKRKLTVPMIRALHDKLGIPLASLIAPVSESAKVQQLTGGANLRTGKAATPAKATAARMVAAKAGAKRKAQPAAALKKPGSRIKSIVKA